MGFVSLNVTFPVNDSIVAGTENQPKKKMYLKQKKQTTKKRTLWRQQLATVLNTK